MAMGDHSHHNHRIQASEINIEHNIQPERRYKSKPKQVSFRRSRLPLAPPPPSTSANSQYHLVTAIPEHDQQDVDQSESLTEPENLTEDLVHMVEEDFISQENEMNEMLNFTVMDESQTEINGVLHFGDLNTDIEESNTKLM